MHEFVNTLLIACIPAVVSGIVSFIVAKSQSNSEIQKLKISNQHDIERLMEQHRIDIDSIREKHQLEMQASEKEHQYKLEIMQKEHENEIIRKESELENTVKYNAVGSVMTGLFNGVIGGALNSPQIQKEMEHQLIDSLRKNGSPTEQQLRNT